MRQSGRFIPLTRGMEKSWRSQEKMPPLRAAMRIQRRVRRQRQEQEGTIYRAPTGAFFLRAWFFAAWRRAVV
jgi:hypothetical protein